MSYPNEHENYRMLEVLSPKTEKARRNLIILGFIAILLTFLDLKPAEVQVIGLKFRVDNENVLVYTLLALNVGAFASFFIAATEDYGRVRLRSKGADFVWSGGAQTRINQLEQEKAEINNTIYPFADEIGRRFNMSVDIEHPNNNLQAWYEFTSSGRPIPPNDQEKYNALVKLQEQVEKRRAIDAKIWDERKRIQGWSYWLIDKSQKAQVGLAFIFPVLFALFAIGLLCTHLRIN